MDEVEMVTCDHCGEDCERFNLVNGLCPECVEQKVYERKYDVDFCYALGEKCKEEIEINGFLLTMFSEDEIEAILYRHLKDASLISAVDCTPFIDGDKSWFTDEVMDIYKKGGDC